MKVIVFGMLCCVSVWAWAEVYTWTDEQGVTHFSDESVIGAEKIKVKPIQTISMPAPVVVDKRGKNNRSLAGQYKILAISSPADDQAVRANNGAVTISVAVTPSVSNGDQLKITVDGKSRVVKGTRLDLTNLDRGTHTASAEILAADGRVLARSESITFFVLRAIAQKKVSK